MTATRIIRGSAILALALCFLVGAGTASAQVVYAVTINTTGNLATGPGNLLFSFQAGGSTAQAETATISNFSAGASTVGGAVPFTLSVTNPTGMNAMGSTNTLTISPNYPNPGSLKFDVTLNGPAITSPNPSIVDANTLGVFPLAGDDITPIFNGSGNLYTGPFGLAGSLTTLNGVTPNGFGTAGNPVTFTLIPEPATALLFAVCLAGLVVYPCLRGRRTVKS